MCCFVGFIFRDENKMDSEAMFLFKVSLVMKGKVEFLPDASWGHCPLGQDSKGLSKYKGECKDKWKAGHVWMTEDYVFLNSSWAQVTLGPLTCCTCCCFLTQGWCSQRRKHVQLTLRLQPQGKLLTCCWKEHSWVIHLNTGSSSRHSQHWKEGLGICAAMTVTSLRC